MAARSCPVRCRCCPATRAVTLDELAHRDPVGRCPRARRCPEAPLLQRAQQAGGDHDFLPATSWRLILARCWDPARRFGEQYQIRLRGKFGRHLDRNTDIAQIRLQVVLAAGLVGLVARDADRSAQPAETRSACSSDHPAARAQPGESPGADPSADRMQHRVPVEAGVLCAPGLPITRRHAAGEARSNQLNSVISRRPGEQGVPQLLGVAIDVPRLVGVHPAAEVAAIGRMLLK